MSSQPTNQQPKPERMRFAPQPKQAEFLASRADIAVYGGARGGGKSYALLLEALRNTPNKDFAAVLFRRTYPQIFQEGGLWHTAEKIYPYAGATGSRGNASWAFPSGATVTMRHMENEKDRYSWLGASIPLIGFDELALFTERQFYFLLGSNRSACGVKPYIRATTNPEPGWLANFLQWWWDPNTGYAIPDRGGVLRWFVRVNEQMVWADEPQELELAYPGTMAKSVTFIPAKVTDNQALLSADPGYMANLMALPLVERERYLGGNWRIKPLAGMVFKREWFGLPVGRPKRFTKLMRFWDIAATVPEDADSDPDWTVGLLMGLDAGVWYIVDVVRLRGRPLEVERKVRFTAEADGRIPIRMEREPGASGPSLIDHYARNVLSGYDFQGVSPIRGRSRGTGAEWYGPLSSAAENSHVKLVAGLWNEAFLAEAEEFTGGDDVHDDQLIAAATAMAEIQPGGKAQVEGFERPGASRPFSRASGVWG